MLSNLSPDVTYALRSLKNRPAFTAAVVLTLALGIGANTAMFATLNAALLQPLPYDDPERLVMGRRTSDGDVGWVVSAYDYYDYRERSRSFESLAALVGFTQRHTVTGEGEPDRVEGILVTWDLFPTLGIRPILGRNFAPEEGVKGGAEVAIISYAYWQQRFGGSEDVLGQALVLDGRPYTLLGVMPPGFHFLFPVDVWRPLYRDGPFANARRWHNLLLVGRLQPDVSLAQASAEVDVISRQLEQRYPDTNKGKGLALTGLHGYLVEDARTPLLLLSVAVTLVLLIACSNVAGLLLARGLTRRSEMAIRASMGASRSRLVAQLMTESVLVASISGLLGVAFAYLAQSWILKLLPVGSLGLERPTLDAAVLLYALALSVLTGLVFGTLPAMRGTAFDLAGQLKAAGRSTEGRGGARLRSALVVAQVAISIVLLVGSGLLIRSLARQMNVQLGYDPSNLLTAEIRLPSSDYPDAAQRERFFTSLVEDVRALPCVEGVGLVNQLPIRDPYNDVYVHPADQPPVSPSEAPSAFIRYVLPEYFETLGMPLVAGRDIAATDVEGSRRAMVISEALARRLFPDGEAVGRQVIADEGEPTEFDVVGVVADARLTSLRDAPYHAMYAAFRQAPSGRMRIAVRTSADPAALVGPIRELLRLRDRNIPLAEPAAMSSILHASASSERIVTASFSVFAGIALVLASVGLYGVLAYHVSQRRHEIGVRMALGANGADLLRWIFGRGFALVGLGLALGFMAALASTRLLRQLLFETGTTDAATFVAVAIVFVGVALLACAIPGLRATRVNPVRALQAD